VTPRRDTVTAETPEAPAPFTQGQVDELVRGTLSEEAVAAVLDAFPARTKRKRARSTKQAPVLLSEEELRGLAEDDVTPVEVGKRLRAAAAEAPPLAKERREAGDQPTRKPPVPRRSASSS